MTKLSMTIKCPLSTGHFDGHGGPPVQYEAPMELIQGYTESYWTPPSGNYSFCIALEAARATGNTTMKTCTHFAGHFDGHGGALVQYRVHCLMEKVHGFTRSHWMPPSGKYCGQ
jgi:hypothetical protein